LTVIAVAGLVVASGAATGAAWLQAHPLGQTQIAAGNVELQECTGQAAPDGDWAADLSQADLANLPAWWWQAEQGNASSDVTALAEFKATAGNVIYINQCVKASLQGDNLSAHFKVDWDFSGTDYDTAWQWTSQLANWGIDLQASGWQAVVPAIQAAGDIAAPATSLGQLGQASQDPVVVALDRQVNAPAGASQVSGPDYRVVYWVLQTKLVFQQTVEADNGPVQLPRPRISAYQVRQGGAF
jgi:hypothetical protein